MLKKIFLMMILLVYAANAATIHGIVYDNYLMPQKDARIEVNSEPKQYYVAKNGTYSFTLPLGNYNIKAQYFENNMLISSAEENISIKKEGNYVLDLILFESFEEEYALLNESKLDLDKDYLETKNKTWQFAVLLGIFIVIIVALFFKASLKARKKEKLESEGDLDKLISLIKAEGGRITQKEIRQRLGLSEAKISLMIAELEHKNKIEKIKRGRGNIIILKK